MLSPAELCERADRKFDPLAPFPTLPALASLSPIGLPRPGTKQSPGRDASMPMSSGVEPAAALVPPALPAEPAEARVEESEDERLARALAQRRAELARECSACRCKRALQSLAKQEQKELQDAEAAVAGAKARAFAKANPPPLARAGILPAPSVVPAASYANPLEASASGLCSGVELSLSPHGHRALASGLAGAGVGTKRAGVADER